jgi:uncharacterized protein YqhQ
MKITQKKLIQIKVDSVYGKKKHFNAADRKEKLHYRIGVPLIIINILTGSILLFVLTDGTTSWLRYLPIALALVAALLSGFQTYLNLQKKVEGHRRVGNRYLAVMKRCDRLQGYIADSAISDDQIINRIEEISLEVEEINKEAEAYPTNENDFLLAKKGIESGEETYTETEINI